MRATVSASPGLTPEELDLRPPQTTWFGSAIRAVPDGMPTSSWAWVSAPGHAHEDVGMPPNRRYPRVILGALITAEAHGLSGRERRPTVCGAAGRPTGLTSLSRPRRHRTGSGSRPR